MGSILVVITQGKDCFAKTNLSTLSTYPYLRSFSQNVWSLSRQFGVKGIPNDIKNKNHMPKRQIVKIWKYHLPPELWKFCFSRVCIITLETIGFLDILFVFIICISFSINFLVQFHIPSDLQTSKQLKNNLC